jgi:hypothetical protein
MQSLWRTLSDQYWFVLHTEVRYGPKLNSSNNTWYNNLISNNINSFNSLEDKTRNLQTTFPLCFYVKLILQNDEDN